MCSRLYLKVLRCTAVVPTVEISPGGQLPSPVTLTFAVDQPLPTDGSIAVATTEGSDKPWSLVEAQVSDDGRTVTVQTDHLSLWTIVKLNVEEAIKTFKDMFLGPLSAGFAEEVSKPSCPNEAGARQDGFTISTNGPDTVYWCFGLDGDQRVLKVVNRRRYPLELQTSGLTPLSFRPVSHGVEQLAKWGEETILIPFQEVTFRVDPSGQARLSSSTSGLAPSPQRWRMDDQRRRERRPARAARDLPTNTFGSVDATVKGRREAWREAPRASGNALIDLLRYEQIDWKRLSDTVAGSPSEELGADNPARST
jgi:hypothetical protein